MGLMGCYNHKANYFLILLMELPLVGGIKCYRIGLRCLSSSDGIALCRRNEVLLNWTELSFFL